jgi:prophage regulatory protein
MFFKQPIVRPKELATVLSISTVTLWSWRKKGIIPEPILFGPRFIGWDREVLNEWLNSQKELKHEE